MKKQVVLLPAILGLLFGGFVLNFVFSSGDKAFAQTSRVSRTVESRPVVRNVEAAAGLARFSAAASQNNKLRSTLTWNFGAKGHKGWNIYVPLIAQTIGSESGPDSAEFASTLSKWQASHGLEATGIVDNDTMGAFVKLWQSQRLGRSNTPSGDRLLSAPIMDFYDPTRSPDLLKLERETYTAYRRMIAAAAKDLGKELRFTKTGELAPGEKYLRIVSAFRTPEYQAMLRKQSPGSGRAALAVNSPHFTGQALDIYVGGEPVSTKDANRMIQVQTPAYRWLVKNAHKFGFRPYFYEPWHWEYVGR